MILSFQVKGVECFTERELVAKLLSETLEQVGTQPI